jgi:hypothetical protein
LFGFGLKTGGTELCYSDALTENCAGPVPRIGWAISTGVNTTVSTGIGAPAGDVIATAATTATPLPAAFPLFATGIAGLSLLGWRRKRKAQA